MGILKPSKRNTFLTKLRREKIDIAFLQETHLTGKEHKQLKRKGFKHIFSSSNGPKHSRGVAILISGSVVYEHLTLNKQGRYIYFD